MAEIYGQHYVYVDGTLLGEATTVSTNLENQDQDAMTIVKDWSGITPSPIKRLVQVTSLIPAAGLEFDYEAAELARSFHTMSIQHTASGTQAKFDGVFRNCRREGGVGQTNTISFDFHGQATPFE